jgi:ParB family chromosome partitioning protein
MARIALGRGLDALIPDLDNKSANQVTQIRLSDVKVSDLQPRQHFDEAKIEELARSIKEKGLIQPIIVRPVGDDYELIAGERRLKAAKKAGFEFIPVIVKDVSEVEALELSLIENIQREELNPIEEAEAYKRLMDEFGLSYDDIAGRVGKDKTTVINSIRLLKLPEKVKLLVIQGKLSSGHSRALLSLSEPRKMEEMAQLIIKKGLSVRAVEDLVRRQKQPRKIKSPQKVDPFCQALEEELMECLGTKVKIKRHSRVRGKIEIEYYTEDDLIRIVERLKGQWRGQE